ncbi:MAG: hypothetical protein ACSHX7_03380 [Luteolibacter sp.]
MDDEISFIFNIPATDPLGKLAVTGKFRAMEEQVILHWKMKDRTFTRASNEMRTIEMTYNDVEEATVTGRWWFSAKMLVVQIKDPRLVEEVPGVSMGKLELELPKKSVESAKKFVAMLDYRMSEAELKKRQERLSDLGM